MEKGRDKSPKERPSASSAHLGTTECVVTGTTVIFRKRRQLPKIPTAAEPIKEEPTPAVCKEADDGVAIMPIHDELETSTARDADKRLQTSVQTPPLVLRQAGGRSTEGPERSVPLPGLERAREGGNGGGDSAETQGYEHETSGLYRLNVPGTLQVISDSSDNPEVSDDSSRPLRRVLPAVPSMPSPTIPSVPPATDRGTGAAQNPERQTAAIGQQLPFGMQFSGNIPVNETDNQRLFGTKYGRHIVVCLFFVLGIGGIAAAVYKIDTDVRHNDYVDSQENWVTTPASIPEKVPPHRMTGYYVMLFTGISLIALGFYLLRDLIKK